MEGVPGIDYLDDNSVEALAGAPAMAAPCKECPFTPGTGASRNPVTARLRDECTKARHAFMCHLTGDAFAKTHLCAGWVASLHT